MWQISERPDQSNPATKRLRHQELGNLLRAKRRYVEAESVLKRAWKQRPRRRNSR